MLVGAGIVASRHVVADVPPLTLAMLRYAIGFACLLGALLLGESLQAHLLAALALIAVGLWLATRMKPRPAPG